MRSEGIGVNQRTRLNLLVDAAISNVGKLAAITSDGFAKVAVEEIVLAARGTLAAAGTPKHVDNQPNATTTVATSLLV